MSGHTNRITAVTCKKPSIPQSLKAKSRFVARFLATLSAITIVLLSFGGAQETAAQAPQTGTPTYQPKFAGDPARSESESQALGYMRVVLRAQKEYYKRHQKYAESLADLAGTGSFTKRMAATTQRGDYTATFHKNKDGYVLTMTPKQLDKEHRSFYAEEDGVIHADEEKAADGTSPKVK
jgi:hypothetical protein